MMTFKPVQGEGLDWPLAPAAIFNENHPRSNGRDVEQNFSTRR
jgi:hypothetical protein